MLDKDTTMAATPDELMTKLGEKDGAI